MKFVNVFTAVFVVFLLLFGCIGDQKTVDNQGVDTSTSTTVNKPSNQTGSVIITSTSNETAAHNATIGQNISSKPPGLLYTDDPTQPIAVYFISVAGAENQGEAILIKKGDVDILLDAGPDSSGGKTLDFLKGKNVDDIEILVSTTADPDRYSGLDAVAKTYDVEEFWWNGNSFEDKNYEALIAKLKGYGIPVKIVSRGTAVTLSGITLNVLNPVKPGGTFGSGEGVSNDAIVIKMTDRKLCTVFTSDILYGGQSQVSSNSDVSCEILQIPNHGLGTATAQITTFLYKANPKYAIISGGKSDDTPDKKGTRSALLDYLKLKKITYYQTYVGGTVRITSDGSAYAIQYVK